MFVPCSAGQRIDLALVSVRDDGSCSSSAARHPPPPRATRCALAPFCPPRSLRLFWDRVLLLWRFYAGLHAAMLNGIRLSWLGCITGGEEGSFEPGIPYASTLRVLVAFCINSDAVCLRIRDRLRLPCLLHRDEPLCARTAVMTWRGSSTPDSWRSLLRKTACCIPPHCFSTAHTTQCIPTHKQKTRFPRTRKKAGTHSHA